MVRLELVFRHPTWTASSSHFNLPVMAKNDVTITSSWKSVPSASFLLAEIAVCNFQSLDKQP
jgi:hypothetical protein